MSNTNINIYVKHVSIGYRDNIIQDKTYNIEDIYKDYIEWCKEEYKKLESKYKFEKEFEKLENKLIVKARTSKRRKGVYRIIGSEIIGSESDYEYNKVYCQGCLWFKGDFGSPKCSILRIESNYFSPVHVFRIEDDPSCRNRYNDCDSHVHSDKDKFIENNYFKKSYNKDDIPF